MSNAEETEINSNRKRKTSPSPIYQHGKIFKLSDGTIQFSCTHTGCTYKCILSGNESSFSSSNAMRHLTPAHKVISPNTERLKQAIAENNNIKDGTIESFAAERQVTPSRYCDLQRALVTIEKMQYLNYYESQNVRGSQIGWEPICATTMICLLLEYFHAFQLELIEVIEHTKNSYSLSTFHLMMDVWMEKQSKDDYFGVRLTFIDHHFELQTRFITLTRYNPSVELRDENAANKLICDAAIEALRAYGLSLDDLNTCTTDKGPEVIAAVVRQMNKPHIWCFAHLLNKVLDASIGKHSPLHGLMQQVRDTIHTIKNSDYNLAYFEEQETSKLCSDVKERWKSAMYMLERVLIYFTAIENTYSNKGVACILTGKKDTILQVYSIIRSITDIITISQNTKYNPMIECVLSFVDLLNSGIFQVEKPIKIVDPADPKDAAPKFIEYNNLSHEAGILLESIKHGEFSIFSISFDCQLQL